MGAGQGAGGAAGRAGEAGPCEGVESVARRELAVYRKILGIAEEQRQHLAQGDLGRFGELMEKRKRLFTCLERLPCAAPEEAKAPIIRRILAVDADNAVLLRCVMEEARAGIAAVSAERLALRFYSHASLPPGAEGRGPSYA